MILTSWKEIAAHLRRGVRTAQRWERAGLPVKRVTKGSRAPVVADSEDIDAWLLRNPFVRSADVSPESRRATIQHARKLRAEAQRNREALHQTLAVLRQELDSLQKTKRIVGKGKL